LAAVPATGNSKSELRIAALMRADMCLACGWIISSVSGA
jgi:hypothetical protein